MFLLPRRLVSRDEGGGVSAIDIPVSVARTLAKLNPTTTFIYVSGREPIARSAGLITA
jgi:hypothetical protein